jgi:hypothetical protein
MQYRLPCDYPEELMDMISQRVTKLDGTLTIEAVSTISKGERKRKAEKEKEKEERMTEETRDENKDKGKQKVKEKREDKDEASEMVSCYQCN